MQTTKVTFTNNSGHELSARLELPEHRKPAAYALFAHCFTCSKNVLAISNISRALANQGIAVFRFDFTGLGNSEGAFEDTSFTTNIEDLEAAAAFMEREYNAPALLIGHSLGGAAALFAAPRIPSIQAVVTIGAPAQPDHVEHLLKSKVDEIEAEGRARVNIGGRDFFIRKQFLDDIRSTSPKKLMEEFRYPLLIMHSPQDTIVGIENAREIYSAAWHPKSFVSLDGADHMLSDKADSLYAGDVIGSWVKRYIELDKPEPLTTDEQVAVRTGTGGYTTDIVAGSHKLLADEPKSVGGSNLGPTPYGLLSAALGACTSMTLRMYAGRKNWPLEEVIVHLSHNKKHAADCEACEKPGTKIDTFTREIELRGNLTQEQQQRLLEIADKCPVHKTLHNEVTVETTLHQPEQASGT